MNVYLNNHNRIKNVILNKFYSNFFQRKKKNKTNIFNQFIDIF